MRVHGRKGATLHELCLDCGSADDVAAGIPPGNRCQTFQAFLQSHRLLLHLADGFQLTPTVLGAQQRLYEISNIHLLLQSRQREESVGAGRAHSIIPVH